MSLEEFLENYLIPCTEDDEEYEYDDCIYKLDKQKYENNVDKDYPGLRKLIDTLKLYNETIKYEKKYNLPPERKKTTRSNINYSSESEDESDNFPRERETIRTNLTYSDFEDESESEDESDRELSNEDIQDILKYIENEDEEIIAYNYDTDTDSD